MVCALQINKSTREIVCTRYGEDTHLVRIETNEEMQKVIIWLTNDLLKQGLWNKQEERRYWTSGHRMVQNGRWVWVDRERMVQGQNDGITFVFKSRGKLLFRNRN